MTFAEELSLESFEDRYSRQKLIACWDQEKVRQARILVAGAGALGNEVLKNLALIGVGNILVVDFDRIEISNLSRTVLFREEDLGRPKASTVARALQQINPEIRVEAIDGDLETDLGLGRIREYELVLGCLDSIHARWALNRACLRAGRAWINAAISATVAEVSLHVSSMGACYECGMTEQMWQQISERRSCMHLPRNIPARTLPSTSVIASLAAGLQVNEALAWIHGQKHLSPGEMLLLSIAPYSLSTISTREKQDCLAHETYFPSISVDRTPAQITVAGLLKQVPGAVSLQLDFDVLESWICANCGEAPVGKRLSAAAREEVQCPRCSAQRSPQLTHQINASDPLAAYSLESLGVPARDILRVKTTAGTTHVELTRNP